MNQYVIRRFFHADSAPNVCDFIGYACFEYALRNKTILEDKCESSDRCPDDCEGVIFSHTYTRQKIEESGLE